MEFWLDYLNQALILSIFAISMNVMMGYAGQMSIANVALGGVAGYLAAFFSAQHEFAFVPCLLIGVAAAMVLGTLLSLPSLRLTPEHLILLTLAFATVAVTALITIPAFGGVNGLTGLQPLNLGGVLLKPSEYLRLTVPALIICFLICWRLVRSPFGRLLRGIREQEDAVRALGKNVVSLKVITFAVTAAIAGIAGVTYVYYSQLATGDQFNFDATTLIIAAIVVGGIGNLAGAVVGTMLLVGLEPALLRFVNVASEDVSLWRLLIYGVVLVVVVRLRPSGLLPEGFSLRGLWSHDWETGGDEAGEPAAGLQPLPAGGPAPAAAGGSAPAAASPSAAPASAAPESAVLVASELTKSFGGIAAVRGMSIDLAPGRITALIGPNGAGKTTVFNLLTGQIPPDDGSVQIRDAVTTGLPPHHVARHGMVRTFQDVRTFTRMSVLDNVMIAVPDNPGEKLSTLFFRPWIVGRKEREARETAHAALEYVGLDNRSDDLAGDLGYGDQKLLAIARLLATEAEILLVDEPAAGVDRAALGPVLAVLDKLRREGKTICLVEHNLEVVEQLADEVLFMEQGRITERGTMAHIVGQERLAEVYFGHHAAQAQEI